MLLGKTLVRTFSDGSEFRAVITETEAYRGEEDLACHASKGKTPRTEVLYAAGGKVYVYLIYGMYWLLNIVTGPKDFPQGVLIRSLDKVQGPGRVGKQLQLDKSFYGENLATSHRLWVEDIGYQCTYTAYQRIGVDYAGIWKNKLWRFVC